MREIWAIFAAQNQIFIRYFRVTLWGLTAAIGKATSCVTEATFVWDRNRSITDCEGDFWVGKNAIGGWKKGEIWAAFFDA
ncbi:hypothetical protein RC90_06095 [Pectobacterium brasiliense]|nr:hypothetical protein B5S52_09905 [Pectobacterium brasiliense]KHS81914.1 hypothetical protein RC81_04930 [Pectobacterium brasiliense]KHT00334.1 hypothetical protein RC90_06095 [Pectobacterium brasiliense]